MKNGPAFYLSVFFSLFIIVCLFVFKTTPESQLWKGYKVVYVSKNADCNIVAKVFKNSGIDEVFYKENQSFPVFSKFAPIQPQSSSSYIERRNAFFYDKTLSYSVYYVNEKYASKIPLVISTLNQMENVKAGTDGHSSFPVLPVVLSLLCAVFIGYFCEHKIIFALLCSVPFLFVLNNPFFCAAGAFMVSLFGFYILQKFWGRKGSVLFLRKSVIVYMSFILPICLLSLSFIKLSLLYFASVCAAFFILFIYYNVVFIIEKKRNSVFKPVLILSARFIGLPGFEGLKVLRTLCAVIFVLLGLSVVLNGKDFSVTQTSSNTVILPSPSSKSDSALPDIRELSLWSWYTLTFPFRKFADSEKLTFENVAEGTRFEFSGISPLVDNAILNETDNLVYNSSFRQSIFNLIKESDEPLFEKVLLKQGESSHFSYVKSGTQSTEKFKIFIISFFLFSCAVALLYYSFLYRKN